MEDKIAIHLVSIGAKVFDPDSNYISTTLSKISSNFARVDFLFLDKLERINQKHIYKKENFNIDKRIIAIQESLKRNISSEINFIKLDDFQITYPKVTELKSFIDKVYDSNIKFKSECINQVYNNLRPILDKEGISKKDDRMVELSEYLKHEIALKIFINSKTKYSAEISPFEELDFITNIYNLKYSEFNKINLGKVKIIVADEIPCIKLQNISFTYPGNSRANKFSIRELSFDFMEYKVTGILGGNGSGKTTLFKLIAGHLIPQKGNIYISNVENKYLTGKRRKVSTVFQSLALFPHLSIYKNIEFGLKSNGLDKDEMKLRIGELLKKFQIDEHANKKPRSLSIGQQQRVAIARSLAMRPEVLLFDEPTASLDHQQKDKLIEIITELRESKLCKAILVISHDADFIRSVCDNVCILKQGKVIGEGNIEDLITQPQNRIVASILRTGNIVNGTSLLESRISIPNHSNNKEAIWHIPFSGFNYHIKKPNRPSIKCKVTGLKVESESLFIIGVTKDNTRLKILTEKGIKQKKELKRSLINRDIYLSINNEYVTTLK